MNLQSTLHEPVREEARGNPFASIKARFFHRVLDRIDAGLAEGAIEAWLPDGRFRILGGRAPGPVAEVQLLSWNALVRLGRSGSVGWYEAYAAGEWDSPDPVPLFDLFMRNRGGLGRAARATGISRIAKRVRHAIRANDRKGARRNVMAHYDLGNDFYARWLDPTMSYSSALFLEPLSQEEPLESAQQRKCEALLSRMAVQPGSSILEIGCGWGHMSRLCASRGHAVTAITLSPAQEQWCEMVGGTAGNPIYQLRDYRDVQGQFDAIVSVEMVEAVGQQYWPAYLDTIARSLKTGGRAALQFIAIADDVFEDYAASADFIQTYVFPGGMLLSERRFRALAEARGLRWEDPHHFPLHYAETLREWRARFDGSVESGTLPASFDDQFVRLWRYYLQYCEGGFRGGGISVAQVTLVKEGEINEKDHSGSRARAGRVQFRNGDAARKSA